jgi:hypothetical protein
MRKTISVLFLALTAAAPALHAQTTSKGMPRQCAAIVDPHVQPPSRSYVDDQKLRAVASSEKGSSEGKFALYKVSIDKSGGVTTSVISTNMPPSQMSRIEKPVMDAITSNGVADVVPFRLLFEPDAEKQPWRAGQAFNCAPVFLNKDEVEREAGALLRHFPSMARAALTVRLQFDTDGALMQSGVSTSSGNASLDSAAVKIVRSVARFEDPVSTVKAAAWSYMVPLTLVKK